MAKASNDDWKTPLGVYERAIAELRRTREEIQTELQNLRQMQASVVDIPKLKAELQNSQTQIQVLQTELEATKNELAITQKAANEAQAKVADAESNFNVAKKELNSLKEIMADESNRNYQTMELLAELKAQLSQINSTTEIPKTDKSAPDILEAISNLEIKISHLEDELTLISPASGIDYLKLRQLLEAKKWKEADRETCLYILRISEREPEKWLDDGDIKRFPRHDLRIIDRLWVKYSGGKFGFSVQDRIWQDVEQDYKKFGDRVGWLVNLVNSDWRKYEEFIFNLSAPIGHLPSTVQVVGLGYRSGAEIPHRLRIFLSQCWSLKKS